LEKSLTDGDKSLLRDFYRRAQRYTGCAL